jgi:hypothetical protein
MRRKSVYTVGVLGFTESELKMLKSLERVLATRAKPYLFDAAADDSCDLYVVNGEDTDAMQRWEALRAQTSSPAIVVSAEGSAAFGQRGLRRPLVASRVLNTLDEVAAGLGRLPLPAAG